MTNAADALARRLTLSALRDPPGVLALAPAQLDLTLRLLRRTRLLGRLAWQLREHVALESLPPPLGDHLTSALVSAQARARVGAWELDRVAWALGADAPRPLVALKGCAYLLAGTPNAHGRSFSDIDLLMPKRTIGATEARLKARGWRSAEISRYDDRYYRTWAHELPPLVHGEREVEVDLHHNIVMATSRYALAADLLLGESRPVAGSPYRVLAPIDMTLHAVTHLFVGELDDGLRELVDIDQLLRHFGEHEPSFWERFWPRAAQLDLGRLAFYGLRYAQRLLGTPVPEAALQASQAAAPPRATLALMDRLLPDALLPPHPDATHEGRLVPTLLLARSHWLRMPPFTLARHLGYKVYRRYRPEKPASA